MTLAISMLHNIFSLHNITSNIPMCYSKCHHVIIFSLNIYTMLTNNIILAIMTLWDLLASSLVPLQIVCMTFRYHNWCSNLYYTCMTCLWTSSTRSNVECDLDVEPSRIHLGIIKTNRMFPAHICVRWSCILSFSKALETECTFCRNTNNNNYINRLSQLVCVTTSIYAML